MKTKNLILIAFSLALSALCVNAIYVKAANANPPNNTLHLFAMSDYLPDDILKGFEKKFGAKIKYDNFANNEELLAKFQAGAKGYDVIIPSDYMVHALIDG